MPNIDIREPARQDGWSKRSGLLFLVLCVLVPPSLSSAQQSDLGNPDTGNIAPQSSPVENRHVLGLFASHRTWSSIADYKPLSTKEKFRIARQESLDPGTIVYAALFAGEAQLTNANPSFGQGVAGYAHNLGASYGDFVIRNYLTEAIYPSLLHQDPRYFRRGAGSKRARLAYSMGQIFWTHTDSDRAQFNSSEIIGSSTAVAISEAYYPDHRNAWNAGTKLGFQIGVDMASNVLKEFWPDLSQKFSRKQHP